MQLQVKIVTYLSEIYGTLKNYLQIDKSEVTEAATGGVL